MVLDRFFNQGRQLRGHPEISIVAAGLSEGPENLQGDAVLVRRWKVLHFPDRPIEENCHDFRIVLSSD